MSKLTMQPYLSTLYKRTQTGAIQTWTIRVEGTTIVTNFGQKDGAIQEARDTITEGKNIGRSNETTAVEQAHAEAQAQWEKKLKKGYVKNLADANAGIVDEVIQGGVDPMLAHVYEKQGHKIVYPAWVQPKLDGHRCIAIVQDGVATLWSRTRKPITGLPHIQRQLELMFPDDDVTLDGELYNHDYHDNFQELSSFIRSATPKPGHEVVQYWVYDEILDLPFEDRLFVTEDDNIISVDTRLVADEEEMQTQFGEYLAEGYEGLMIRNAKGEYKNGRSYDLQKVKEFDDAEFEVVRVEAGRGKMSDKGLFICVTEDGLEFKVKMVGPLDSLKKYLDDPAPWIGKQLTVKFQGRSNDGIPRFAVALRFREDV